MLDFGYLMIIIQFFLYFFEHVIDFIGGGDILVLSFDCKNAVMDVVTEGLLGHLKNNIGIYIEYLLLT